MYDRSADAHVGGKQGALYKSTLFRLTDGGALPEEFLEISWPRRLIQQTYVTMISWIYLTREEEA